MKLVARCLTDNPVRLASCVRLHPPLFASMPPRKKRATAPSAKTASLKRTLSAPDASPRLSASKPPVNGVTSQLPAPASRAAKGRRASTRLGSTTNGTTENIENCPGVVDGEDALYPSPGDKEPECFAPPNVDEDVPSKAPAGTGAKKRKKSAPAEQDDSQLKPNPVDDNGVVADPELAEEEGVTPEELWETSGRPPPVNSDYLPLPWKGRLGYVSLSISFYIFFGPDQLTQHLIRHASTRICAPLIRRSSPPAHAESPRSSSTGTLSQTLPSPSTQRRTDPTGTSRRPSSAAKNTSRRSASPTRAISSRWSGGTTSTTSSSCV